MSRRTRALLLILRVLINVEWEETRAKMEHEEKTDILM